MPLAPLQETSSKGEFKACLAACLALSGPLALPIPKIARTGVLHNRFDIRKADYWQSRAGQSNLIWPVPPASMSHRNTKNLVNRNFRLKVLIVYYSKLQLKYQLSFKFSQAFMSYLQPLGSFKRERRCYHRKSQYSKFLAISATTALPPEPHPPPKPQVINAMSAPKGFFDIFSCSSAANLPISGFMPVPSPLVSSFPVRILTWALVFEDLAHRH